MEQIEITTIQQAKKYLSPLAILQVILALRQGHTVTVVDKFREREFIFQPEQEGAL